MRHPHRYANSEHEERVVTEVERHAAALELRKVDEGPRHGRYMLVGGWSWTEVVTLANGVYVGGDTDTVVFQGHPDRNGPRSALYWMGTRSYGYAAEKARMGDTGEPEWDRACAAEQIIDWRIDGALTREEARDLYDALTRRHVERHDFLSELCDAIEDSDCYSAGQVVPRKVYLATAILRRLTHLLEVRDFRASSNQFFRKAA